MNPLFKVVIILFAAVVATEAALFDVCHHGGCAAVPCDSACASTGDSCGDQGICRSKSVNPSCIVCVSNSGAGDTCSTDADCECGDVCIDGQGFSCDSLA